MARLWCCTGAGLYLAFKTAAEAISLNASLISEASEGVNCGVACNTGVDMYAWDGNSSAWRWVSTAWPGPGGWSWSGKEIHKQMVADPALPARGITRYRINLPIYNGFTSAQLGVPEGGGLILLDPLAAVAPAPILFYGTSIVNGHVGSLGPCMDFPVNSLDSNLSVQLYKMFICGLSMCRCDDWKNER